MNVETVGRPVELKSWSFSVDLKRSLFSQSPLLVSPFNTIAIAPLASPTMGCISSAPADETCVSLARLSPEPHSPLAPAR